MGAATYLPAPDVAATAMPLIAEYHSDLASAPIVYVFRSPPSRSRDRIVLGRALRVMGLNAFLVALAAGEAPDDFLDAVAADHTFFVMEIALEYWQDAAPEARAAIVDHELCHFYIDPENGELKIRAHDLEEFDEVVYRHGAWHEGIRSFVGACAAQPTPV